MHIVKLIFNFFHSHKCSRHFGLAAIIVMGAPHELHATVYGPTRKVVECLAEMALDDYPWNRHGTSSEMLAAIDPKTTQICDAWLSRETWRFVAERYKIATKNCLIMSDEDYGALEPNIPRPPYGPLDSTSKSIITQSKELKARIVSLCKSDITASAIIAANSVLSDRYQKAKTRETEAANRASDAEAKAKARTDKIESNKNSIRNFAFKELNLESNKAHLLKLGSPRGEWKCTPPPSLPEIEQCVAQLSTQACYTVEENVAAGFLARKTQKCDTSYLRAEDSSVGMRPLLTIAGIPVKRLEATFYQGQMMRLSIYPGKYESALEAGLTEKYGQPDKVTEQRKEWLGLDESLVLHGQLTIERPSLVNKSQQRLKELQESERVEELRKTQESFNQKKKDI